MYKSLIIVDGYIHHYFSDNFYRKIPKQIFKICSKYIIFNNVHTTIPRLVSGIHCNI